MKSVLISIQPKWCELIANGTKTVEVRKTRPKIDTPFKVYIYCTHPKKWFRFSSIGRASDESLWLANGKVEMCDGFKYWHDGVDYTNLNGKVIGEFVCDEIEEHSWLSYRGDYGVDKHFLSKACLSYKDMREYGNEKNLYCWHISDLVIYDKPKELSEIYRYCGDDPKCDGCEAHYYYSSECGIEDECCSLVYCCKPLTRPPQSWCYVEKVGEG